MLCVYVLTRKCLIAVQECNVIQLKEFAEDLNVQINSKCCFNNFVVNKFYTVKNADTV